MKNSIERKLLGRELVICNGVRELDKFRKQNNDRVIRCDVEECIREKTA